MHEYVRKTFCREFKYCSHYVDNLSGNTFNNDSHPLRDVHVIKKLCAYIRMSVVSFHVIICKLFSEQFAKIPMDELIKTINTK